jgi:hypothetical protein
MAMNESEARKAIQQHAGPMADAVDVIRGMPNCITFDLDDGEPMLLGTGETWDQAVAVAMRYIERMLKFERAIKRYRRTKNAVNQ